MIPARGVLLVRPIETSETLPGGRVVLIADHRQKLTADQFEVVAVGAFALCEPFASRAERKCQRPHAFEYGGDTRHTSVNGFEQLLRRTHAHTIVVGDWILCAPRSTIAGPDPEDSARFVHQDAVWAIFTETQP